MRKTFLVLLLTFFANNAHSEAVVCEKMKGNMLDISNKYIDINFKVEQEVIQWSKDSEKILFITGDEQQEFFKVVDDDYHLRGVSAANGTFLLTYDKSNNKAFYSKHGLFISQYFAKCKKMN